MKYVKDSIYGAYCVEMHMAAFLGGRVLEFDYDFPDWSSATFNKRKDAQIFLKWLEETPSDYVFRANGIFKNSLRKFVFLFKCVDHEDEECFSSGNNKSA